MHLVHLFFELAYPFQIEVLFLVLRILLHCRYDAFIASKLCTTKVLFQFWEQIEDRRGHIRRIWGMGKDFESAFSRNSHGNLRRVSRRIVLQEQNASSQFSSPLSCNFQAQTPQFCCILCTIYRATLFNINKIMITPWPSQKTEAFTFPAEETLLNLFGGGEPGCFHCMLCIFDSASKWWTHVSSWVTTQSTKSPGSSSYRDRRYLEISSRDRFGSSVNILSRPWAYSRYLLELFALPKNLCPLRWLYFASLASCHIARLWTISTFSSVVASLGRPDLASSSMLSLPRLNSAAHF